MLRFPVKKIRKQFKLLLLLVLLTFAVWFTYLHINQGKAIKLHFNYGKGGPAALLTDIHLGLPRPSPQSNLGVPKVGLSATLEPSATSPPLPTSGPDSCSPVGLQSPLLVLHAKPPALVPGPGFPVLLSPELAVLLGLQSLPLASSQPPASGGAQPPVLSSKFPSQLGSQSPATPGLQSLVIVLGWVSPALLCLEFPVLLGPQPTDLGDPPFSEPGSLLSPVLGGLPPPALKDSPALAPGESPDLVSGAQPAPAFGSLMSLVQGFPPAPPWEPSPSAVVRESPTPAEASKLPTTVVAGLPHSSAVGSSATPWRSMAQPRTVHPSGGGPKPLPELAPYWPPWSSKETPATSYPSTARCTQGPQLVWSLHCSAPLSCRLGLGPFRTKPPIEAF
ncbi:hypothetical protein J4Q44_G00119260 [Coregonus suidteri]|uniref:Uncharacterized protein n=1 Tax=Coregonus suidteri TaxID=861788 RepID=A0AAN8QVW6_9TELE